MPAKKTRKPDNGTRYLLSADRKFRRLSLKKISERVKSVRRRTRARSNAKTATAAEPVVRASRNPSPANAPVAFVLMGAVLFAVFVGTLWSSPAPVDAKETAAVLTGDMASAPAAPAKSIIPAPAVTAPPALNASPVAAPETPKPAARPVEAVKVRTEATPALAPAALSPMPVDAHQEVAASSIDTVTIAGCLDYDGKSAWLRDTSGAEAPVTRSWRSGFLKKRSSRIALVDGPASAAVYDGRRVSVTGVLVDREMRVNAMNPIEGDCK